MLLRQTLLYLPSQLAGPVAQFAFAIIWTHWMTQGEYGLLTFMIAGQELIFLCCVSWWSLYVLRFFGGAAPEKERIVAAVEPVVLVVAIVPQVLMNIGLLASLGELGNISLLVASIAYVIGRSFVQYFGERVRTKARIALYTMIQTGSLLAGGLFGFLLVAFVDRSAAAVIAGFALAYMLVTLALLVHLRIGAVRLAYVDRALLIQAAGFGLPLVAAGVINWINLNGIRVIVEAMGSAEAVGLLAVGWGLGQRLSTTVAMLVTTAAFPLAARSLEQGATPEAMKHLEGGGTLLVGLVLPAALGFWVVTPQFVHLLIAAHFQAITISLLPFAVATGAIRNIRVHYADMAFILFEKTGRSVLVNSVEAVMMIATCAVGYKTAGLHGAVVGAFAASTLAAVLAFVLAHRFGLPLPLACWARIVAAACVMTQVLVTFRPALAALPDIVQIACLAPVGVLAYAAALACLFPLPMAAWLKRSAPHLKVPLLAPSHRPIIAEN